MAFMKYAKATVVRPHVTTGAWRHLHQASKGNVRVARAGKPSDNLIERASAFVGRPFNPDDYLLTHATIVSSVDVYTPPGVKTGTVSVDGFKAHRKYSDFRVTPETDKYINNNLDCWSRGVLAKAYPTFIGGHNFVEHVQVEDLSKGRIIDACARDIGESLYIDILIATDRKHRDLVAAIQSGKMGTLSMGCFLPGTLVTMSDGTRIPIEDVQPGDFVLTHKGRPREVLNKQIRGGKWEMRTVKAVGLPLPITSTGNHPYYVLRAPQTCVCGCGEALPDYSVSGEKPTFRSLTRRFKVGHDKRVLNPNATYTPEEFAERKSRLEELQRPVLIKVRADELRVGDLIAFPRVKDDGEVVAVTEGRARLLGYFLAEGSFLKHKGCRTAIEFNFSMSEKPTLVAEVVRLLEQEFPEANKPWVQDREDRNTCTVHLTSSEVAEWFFTHAGEYSYGKRLSADVMNWSVENHKHLIGAWLDGDGHRAKAHGGFLSGVTVSADLASQLHALMARCGWFARMGVRTLEGKRPAYTLTIGNTQSVELQGYCAKAPKAAKYKAQNFRVLEDWVVAPITSIESSTYEGWVHDMEVDEDHTYIAGGAAVSNCTVDGTICTKCGHWAADETEMCPCIKYMKGNVFFDDQGRRHRVAELCGHASLNPTGGVTFIEASWVETPAFEGAVLRNILQPTPEVNARAAHVLGTPPPQWTGHGEMKVAKSALEAEGQYDHKLLRDFGPARMASTVVTSEEAVEAAWSDDMDQDEGGEEPKSKPEESVDGFKDLEDEVYRTVQDRVRERFKRDLTGPAPTPEQSTSTNENLQKQASRMYRAALDAIVRTASTDTAMIDSIATYNNSIGVRIPVEMYRAALDVGSHRKYANGAAFRKACRVAMGRPVKPSEIKTLLRLSMLISRRGSSGQSSEGR